MEACRISNHRSALVTAVACSVLAAASCYAADTTDVSNNLYTSTATQATPMVARALSVPHLTRGGNPTWSAGNWMDPRKSAQSSARDTAAAPQAPSSWSLMVAVSSAALAALVFVSKWTHKSQDASLSPLLEDLSTNNVPASCAMAFATGTKVGCKAKPSFRAAETRIPTYLQAEDPSLTIGTGPNVPEFMKGKTVDILVDLADIRTRLDGVGVCLLGMSGSQKVQIAKNLSDALKYAPMDTLQVLEAITGETAAAVLMRDGKEDFRTAEKDILSEIAAYRRVVLTTSADVVTDTYNWSNLRHFVTVYLSASPERLAANLEAEGADAVYIFEKEVGSADLSGVLTERIQALMKERATIYAQADITVDADARPDVVALRVSQALAQLLDDNAEHVKSLKVPQDVTVQGDINRM